MKKYLLSLALAIFILSFASCSSFYSAKPELNYRVSTISIIDDMLSFEIYLERPDLAIKQPDNDGLLELSDFPEALRPEEISVIRTSDSTEISCSNSTIPHHCEFTINPENDDFEQLLQQYKLKVAFMDGAVLEKSLLLPNVLPLDKPEISSPSEEDEDKSVLTFKNTGAPVYRINLALCYDYANDGINPCLDDEDYVVSFKDGVMSLEENEGFFPAELKTFDDTFQLDFDFDASGYSSINYEVIAVEDGGNYNGASAYRSSSDFLEVFLD